MLGKVIESDSGIKWEFEEYGAFFGNKKGSEIELNRKFVNLEFKKIKQNHGNQIVLASNEVSIADGQYTSLDSTGLIIKTADCIPLFIFDLKLKNIMAIHSGWRGIVNKISHLAVNKLIQMGGDARYFKSVIGPHIKKKSFEVDSPVWIQLIDSIPLEYHENSRNCYDKISDQKYKVDLESIMRLQLISSGVELENIETVDFDTVSDVQWHSYRRDKENSGRNISFNWRQQN